MSSGAKDATMKFRSLLNTLVERVSYLSALPAEELLSLSTSTSSPKASPSPSFPSSSSVYMNVFEGVLNPLIRLLDEILEALKKVGEIPLSAPDDGDATTSTQKKVSPPPDIMSLAHLRALYTVVEVLWLWGVESFLLKKKLIRNSTTECHVYSVPKSIVMKASLLEEVFLLMTKSDNGIIDILTVWSIVLTIARIVRHVSLKGMMLPRNLQRVILAAISMEPLISNIDQSMLPCNLLKDIELSEDIFLYVAALHHVTRIGMAILQKKAAVHLSAILLSKDLESVYAPNDNTDRLGLTVMLRFHLDGLSDTSNPTELLVRIAKLITSVPSICKEPKDLSSSGATMTKEQFFDNISSQLLQVMLSTADKGALSALDENSCNIMRVCVLATARVAHLSPTSSHSYIFLPISEMLRPAESSCNIGGKDISCCILILHWIITCYPLSLPVLNSVNSTDIIRFLLSLKIFLVSSAHVISSNVAGFVTEICIKIIRNTTNILKVANVMEQLIQNEFENDFRLNSEGQIFVLSKSETQRSKGGSSSSRRMDILLDLIQHERDGVFDESKFAELIDGVCCRANALCCLLRESLEPVALDEQKRHRSSSKKSKLILDDDGSLNRACKVASILFLRALAGYLEMNTRACETDSGVVHTSNLPSHTCGTILLCLKNNIPMEYLLHDSIEILRLLGLFLEKHAQHVSVESEKSRAIQFKEHDDQAGQETDFIKQFVTSNGSARSAAQGQPLIQELPTDSAAPVHTNQNLNLNSYSEAEDSIFSMLNIPLSDDDVDETEEDEGIIVSVLALLVSMLEVGNRQRSQEEESLLRTHFLPHLVVIAGQDRNVRIAQTASDLCLMIMTRNVSEADHRSSSDFATEKDGRSDVTDVINTFQSVCDEVVKEYIFHESPAMRGLGVRKLIVALREPKEPLLLEDVERASVLLLHLLQDPESFVYLNAVHAIGRLIDKHRKVMFPKFIRYYNTGVVDHAPLLKPSNRNSPMDNQYELSLRHRAVLSEAIACALRRADELAHLCIANVIAVCIPICRRRTKLNTSLRNINENGVDKFVDVDLTAMKVSVVDTCEGNDDDFSAHSSDSKELNEICSSADEVLFRQSAFSLLAEAVGLAGATVRKYLLDVVDLAVGVLRQEIATVNNNYDNVKDVVPVRRSASFLLRHIVAGVSNGAYSLIDIADHSKDILRTLRLVSRDKDEVVAFHADCALADFDHIMMEQLTLSESQLVGEDLPKIRVLR